MAEDKAILSV